ncbi:MAG: HAD-IIA family hydrolase [Clostridia bacterium]|nr:HAD-IIA family hydrolase [Clostridia bacterium]
MDNGIELYLIDLDGTVYVDDSLIEGAVDALERIRRHGKKLCFLTNNSSRSNSEYVEKLKRLGISVDSDEVYTSGEAAAYFLKHSYANRRIFVVGTTAFKQELIQKGIDVCDFDGAMDCEKPDAVLLGFDTTLTYDKLARLCAYLFRGVDFIVTHMDDVCPAKPYYIPDVGSFVELIYKTTKVLPKFNCGKPEGIMADAVKAKFNLPSNKIAMVGDRLNTDIAFAVNNGFTSILVLSGETDTELYAKSGIKADIVLRSIAEIERN